MGAPNEKEVLGALARIVDPDLGRDVVSLGMIKDLEISEAGRVSFTFELTTPACPVRDRFKTQAEEHVSALPGVTEVAVQMTASVRAAFGGRNGSRLPPGIKHTIAVASGKGGVGKSTVAVNLAAALAGAGAKVGLLDADIYGPSVPVMTGVREPVKLKDGKLLPLDAFGIRTMSIGYIGNSAEALVWRGPLISKAIDQFIGDVVWGELDYLIVDLPPGTGDASLTVAQRTPLTGVVVVTTPQDVALDIALKALGMFKGLNVTALGLVENMSFFICPDCGHEHHIFAHGGAKTAAERLGVPFLGAIPLESGIREDADAGTPVVVSRPDSAGAKAFRDVAEQIAARVSIQSFRQLPVINIR